MPTTFTWSVLELGVENKTVDGHDDMVSVVYWQCLGEQESNGVQYTAKLERNSVIPYHSDHPYVLYTNLTEAEALEWVFEQDKVKTNTEAEIQAMIDAQITPAILTPALPWESA